MAPILSKWLYHGWSRLSRRENPRRKVSTRHTRNRINTGSVPLYTPKGKFLCRPSVPETVWVTIPQALYERDCEAALEVARLAGEYSAVAELKLFEIYPYRLRGEDGGPQSGPVWKPLSQVAFDNLTPTLFRHGALIRYSVLTPQAVDLRIYDVQGRLVRNLACGAHKPGTYDAHWDGTDERGRRLPGGTYFYRLVSAEGQMTRKVVLAE